MSLPLAGEGELPDRVRELPGQFRELPTAIQELSGPAGEIP